MPETVPTAAVPISTLLPVTRPLAFWNCALTVYAELEPKHEDRDHDHGGEQRAGGTEPRSYAAARAGHAPPATDQGPYSRSESHCCRRSRSDLLLDPQ